MDPKKQNHYELAAVYATLLAPDASELDQVLGRLAQAGDGVLRRIMDPCCGPAAWLRPLAERGMRVAGNDIEPAMVRQARLRLRGFGGEITQGDMGDLRFESGPFDAAINLRSSLGHLESDDEVVRHLRSVAQHLRPGGAFLVEVTILAPDSDGTEILELDTSPFEQVPGHGSWAIRYRSMLRDPARRRERIEVRLTRRDQGRVRETVQHSYELLTFTSAGLKELLTGSDFELARCWTDHGEIELAEATGDITLGLRRR